MTFARLIAFAATALALSSPAAAQNPRLWLDTDRGPLFIELDQAKAPKTTAHILELVDEGHYDGLIVHRVVKGFIVQTGRFTVTGASRNVTDTVESERDNGLLNTPGTVAIALPYQNGQAQHDSGTSEFFINTGTNTTLDPDFTVFGKVVYGMSLVDAMDDIATVPGTDSPRSAPVIRRTARIQGTGFPLMPLHTAAWHDPAQSYRGLSVEVTTASGQPVLVVYWYERQDGEQVWMTGAAPFAYGATEVEVPLVLTSGGDFGSAYDPAAVVLDPDFGTLTVRFTDCDHGSFDYDTGFGSGTLTLERLTAREGPGCPAN